MLYPSISHVPVDPGTNDLPIDGDGACIGFAAAGDINMVLPIVCPIICFIGETVCLAGCITGGTNGIIGDPSVGETGELNIIGTTGEGVIIGTTGEGIIYY